MKITARKGEGVGTRLEQCAVAQLNHVFRHNEEA